MEKNADNPGDRLCSRPELYIDCSAEDDNDILKKQKKHECNKKFCLGFKFYTRE